MSLDPETLPGNKSEVLKAAVSASPLGVLWRRQFKFAEATSSLAAGLGSAIYIALAIFAHSGIAHEDVRGGIIFITGPVGTHVFPGITTYAPEVIRKLIRRFTGMEPAGLTIPNRESSSRETAHDRLRWSRRRRRHGRRRHRRGAGRGAAHLRARRSPWNPQITTVLLGMLAAYTCIDCWDA